MARSNILDYVNGLIVPSEKTASPSLEHLNLFELEELMGVEKVAVSSEWIKKMVGKAERSGSLVGRGEGFALRHFEAQASQARRGVPNHVRDAAGKKRQVAQDAIYSTLDKKANAVTYTGQVNNGVAAAPEWPRAALGVDSAGRKATPEEKREQEKTVTPDVQHAQPQQGGEDFEKKVAELVVEKVAVSEKWIRDRAKGLVGAEDLRGAASRLTDAGYRNLARGQDLARVGKEEAAKKREILGRISFGRGASLNTRSAEHSARNYGLESVGVKKLAGILDPAVAARARNYMAQVAKRHGVVRSAIPDMASTGAKLRAAAEAKAPAPIAKVFKKPQETIAASAGPRPSGDATVPTASAGIAGSHRRRPDWAATAVDVPDSSVSLSRGPASHARPR